MERTSIQESVLFLKLLVSAVHIFMGIFVFCGLYTQCACCSKF